MNFNFVSIAALVFIIGLLVNAWRGRTKGQSADEFNNMAQTGTWVYICGCYTATVLSSAGMIGLPGLAYTNGFLIGVLNWGCTLAFIASGLFLGPRLRKFGKVTFGEYYSSRFESDRLRTLVSVVTAVGTSFYFIGQSIGSATVLEQVLGIPYKGAVLFAISIAMFIALIGGAESSTKMDTIQLYVMAIGLGLIFAPAVMFAAGFDKIAAMAAAQPELFQIGGVKNVGFGSILGYIVLWAFGFSANPVNLTRAFIARDDREWLKGLLAGFAIVSILIWTMEFAGISMRAINPDITVGDRVIPWAVLNLFGPIIGFISTIALTSDSLTTANTQLLVIGQSIARDIIGFFKKDLTEELAVKLTKIFIVVVGICGILLAVTKLGFVYAFAQFGSSVFAAAFFPSLVFGLYNKRITKQAASVSIAVGLVVDFVLQMYPMVALGEAFGYAKYLPYQIHPVLWSLAASTLSLLIVNAVTKPTDTQIEAYDIAMAVKFDKTGMASDSSVIKFAIIVLVVGTLQYGLVLALANILG